MVLSFLAVSAIAIVFMTLGALSVWVVVLTLALKALLAVPIVIALFLLWQHFYGSKS